MENRRAARRSAMHPRIEVPVWAEFEDLRDARPVDEERADEAYKRLIDAEQMLYDRWERETGSDELRADDHVGLLLSLPVTPEGDDRLLWILGLGEKVAALGGHLELRAVFAQEEVTLIREPGPEGQPPILERIEDLPELQPSPPPTPNRGEHELELTPDERGLLISGLVEWDGSARPTEPLVQAMGFADLEDFATQRVRLARALRDQQPLTPADWQRVLIATEIAFASEYFGVGTDWEACTGYDDEDSLGVLREIQGKIIAIVTRPPRPPLGFGNR